MDPASSTQDDTIDVAIEELLETYHDHTVDSVDELREAPSALEFLRFVARNRPFVIRGGAADWDAVKSWNEAHLRRVMAKDEVGRLRVAMTPHGNADSVIEHNGELMFVKPCEVMLPFSRALDMIQEQERSSEIPGIVAYGQAQNDNAALEYGSLIDSLPKDGIRWASLALGSDPEAVNIWLGGSRSVTSLHKDPYENIYVQIIGQKHFVLLPPAETACVGERQVRTGTYCRCTEAVESTQPDNQEDDVEHWIEWRDVRLEPSFDTPSNTIPVASWDPDSPVKISATTKFTNANDNTTHLPASYLQQAFQDNTISTPTSFSHLSRPLRFTLNPGDMLYLPSLWYHKVSQTCGPEDFVMAVNHWYDLDWSGGTWATNQFLRRTSNIANTRKSAD